MLRLGSLCVGLMIFFLSWGIAQEAEAGLSASVCSKLAGGKAYPEASLCFLRLSKEVNVATASKVEKKLKGLYMINAAKLIEKEASRRKKPSIIAYFRERAATIFQSYLKQKLCSQKFRCQEIQGRLWKLNQAIQYGRLTLVTRGKGKITLTGYKFQKELSFPPANINQKLRPGAYKLVIIFSSNQSKVLDIKLPPNGSKVLTIESSTPKTIKRMVVARRSPARRVTKKRVTKLPKKPKAPSAPVWSWILVGTGAAVVIGGVVLAGMGATITGDSRAAILRLNPDRNFPDDNGDLANTSTDQFAEIKNNYDFGAGINTAGWVFVGVGIAAAAGGVLGMVAGHKPDPSKIYSSRFLGRKHATFVLIKPKSL